MNFYGNAQSRIEANWDYSKISQLEIDISNKILTYFAAASAIFTIWLTYKIRKRRIVITIHFILSGIVFIAYIFVTDSSYWLVIILKAFNGFILGYFQSIHISYMMYFSDKDSFALHGCLVQFCMFLSLILLNLMLCSIQWKIVCIIIAAQSFLFSVVIWLVPEAPVPSKSLSCQQIYHKPYLQNMIIMLAVMFIQCFSGIGFMIENCPRLMQKIGLEMQSEIYSVLTNFIGCLSTLISAFIMDIVGVRMMWFISGIGLVISLIIYDITLKVSCPNWLGVFAVFLYFLFFGLGEGPVPWLLCGVIFPEYVMIESGGINCFMNRFMDIWFGYVSDAIRKNSGEFVSVIVNAAFSLLGALLGLIFIPTFKNVHPENTSLL